VPQTPVFFEALDAAYAEATDWVRTQRARDN
jgi:hypothetical protein